MDVAKGELFLSGQNQMMGGTWARRSLERTSGPVQYHVNDVVVRSCRDRGLTEDQYSARNSSITASEGKAFNR